MIRSVCIYFFTIFTMRLLGKRQVGQMQMSELVTAFFLSELATCVITDDSIPVFWGIIPILAVVAVEVIISFLTVKSPFFKRIFDFSPTILIRDGEILQKTLRDSRMTLDELLSLLRLAGYWNLSDVRFAFLEPNGQLSVVPFAAKDTVKREDLSLEPEDGGYSVLVIDDGKKNKRALCALGQSEQWVNKQIKKEKGSSEKDFFFLSCDLLGNIKSQKKKRAIIS